MLQLWASGGGRHRATRADRAPRPPRAGRADRAGRAGRAGRVTEVDDASTARLQEAPVEVPAPVAAPPVGLVPPFAAATSWAVQDDDVATPLEDATTGALAPGDAADGPFSAGPPAAAPFAPGPFAAFAAGAGPVAGPVNGPGTGPTFADELLADEPQPPLAAAPAPEHTGSPADSPYLARFAELCAQGLMSEAELARVTARLG